MLIRFGIPNKYDHAPKHTRVQVVLTGQQPQYYEQISSNEAEPIWEKIEIEKEKTT